MAYVILIFVLVPFTLVALFYFVTALRHSFQNWKNVESREDVVVWAALLIFELGSAGGFGFLVYWAIVAIDRGVGF